MSVDTFSIDEILALSMKAQANIYDRVRGMKVEAWVWVRLWVCVWKVIWADLPLSIAPRLVFSTLRKTFTAGRTVLG